MRKKAVSLVLALVMCLGLTTIPAWAGDGFDTPLIIVQISKDDRISFNPSEQATPLSGPGWNYVPSTRTLTLDNFNGERVWFSHTGMTVLELKGNNVISSVTIQGSGDYEDGDRTTITGDGTLTVDYIYIGSYTTQTSATITLTGRSDNYKGISLMNHSGNNIPIFHMTGGTLNAAGRDYGIFADHCYVLMEGGTVTAQGGYAAIWCEFKSERHYTGMLSFGGRGVIGGETAADTQVLSIQSTKRYMTSNYFANINTVATHELPEGEGYDAKWLKDPGLAKYIHITGTGSAQPQQPTTPTMSQTATPSNNSLSVDGTAASTAVYKIDGNNYFKLRDVASLLNGSAKQFNVGYDSATKSATVTTGHGYSKLSTDLQPAPAGAQTATASTDSVIINGTKVDLTAYKIDGANYFKLRDLGKALDFYVDYDDATKSVSIDTSKPYSE